MEYRQSRRGQGLLGNIPTSNRKRASVGTITSTSAQHSAIKGPIHDSNFQPQPQFPTATSTKFPVYGLQQPQPQPQIAGRGGGCCRSELSDIWWAELKVAVEVAMVYGQKRPDLVSCALIITI